MAMATDTLGNLRAELRVRLGYAANPVADAPDGMDALLNSFLIGAHEQLQIMFEWPERRRDWIFPLVPGQTLYPLPVDDCERTPDPERILGVFIEVGSIWQRLERGIDPPLYTIATRGIPNRYDIAHGNANPAIQPPGVEGP